MTDEEALKKIEEFRRKDWQELWPGFMEVAANALRERVAAKKPKRPTLEEMEKSVLCCAITSHGKPHNDLSAAADLIKAVRERMIPDLRLISAKSVVYIWDMWAREVLELLGEAT